MASGAHRRRGQARFCSQRCWGKVQTRVNREFQYSRSRGGKREDLEGRYFRSAWEANWARYLNLLVQYGEIQGWEYEVDTFEFSRIRRGSRFYTPDFKVTNRNGSIEYHEVKGWMDPASATKLKRMAKYHPTVRMVVVDQAMYRGVAQKMGAMIPEWERSPKKVY